MHRTVRQGSLAVAAAALLAGCGANAGTGKVVPAFATPNRPSIASGVPRLHTPQIVTITFANGHSSGPSRVAVNRNSRVRLSVTADVVDRVVVQGYPVDLLTVIHAPVQAQFVADHAGTFAVRLRSAGTLLTTLVVS